MSFISSNILLIVLAAVSGAMLLWPFLKTGKGGASVTPNAAVLMINRENAIVLDVRDLTEFSAGHISEAKHIPLAELDSRLKELTRYKAKPVIVNCQGGVRSAKACDILRKNDFSQVYNLSGGLNAWTQAKLPTIKA